MIHSALENGQDSEHEICHWFGHHVQHKDELIDLGGFILTDTFYGIRVVSPSFINSALKNEIWKIPLQIFIFWML